ncbi:MAG: dihydroorotase [Saccharofermentanales bacterium]|jgi:dihydroorotase|nr:dihydroorotase [Clostridiaceae bacterium]
MRMVVENGHVVDPATGFTGVRPVYIEHGLISDGFEEQPDRIIDATGLAVFPGLIDAHCHLREPGHEYREDIVSGTKSAAKGGFTTVACMPNTVPVCDHAALVRFIKEKSAKEGYARVLPIGALSKEQKGLELAEIGLMAAEGIVAVSDDGRPVERADIMRKGMLYANHFGLTVISHCEDLSLAEGGHMNEGLWSTTLGLRGIPTVSESMMVARECLLSEYLELPVHIAHVSTRASVDLIRAAKARGVQVSAETCPHYFTLTDQACQGFDTNAKMNPPLRAQEDVDAIIKGLQDGTIDMIATDHAPHHSDEKDLEFGLANNGIVGFETALALGYTFLVRTGFLTLPQWLATMTTNPAKLLQPDLGTLTPGRPADLVLVDLENPFIFDRDAMLSKARNTPFHGWELYGQVQLTICDGRVTYE